MGELRHMNEILEGKTVCIFPFIRPIPRSTVTVRVHQRKPQRADAGAGMPEVLRKKQAFLYPEHLRMMGRYNSLFGVDLDVWKRMREMLKLCGVDRVVVNLL